MGRPRSGTRHVRVSSEPFTTSWLLRTKVALPAHLSDHIHRTSLIQYLVGTRRPVQLDPTLDLVRLRSSRCRRSCRGNAWRRAPAAACWGRCRTGPPRHPRTAAAASAGPCPCTWIDMISQVYNTSRYNS